MIVTFRVIFLTYFVVTLPDICFVSISVDGTYWSAIVFNKDQLTQPACVQFMGENQQSTLATIFNAKAQEDVQSLDSVNTGSRPQSTMSLHPGVIV